VKLQLCADAVSCLIKRVAKLVTSRNKMLGSSLCECRTSFKIRMPGFRNRIRLPSSDEKVGRRLRNTVGQKGCTQSLGNLRQSCSYIHMYVPRIRVCGEEIIRCSTVITSFRGFFSFFLPPLVVM
jgi:hypothetical protein